MVAAAAVGVVPPPDADRVTGGEGDGMPRMERRQGNNTGQSYHTASECTAVPCVTADAMMLARLILCHGKGEGGHLVNCFLA